MCLCIDLWPFGRYLFIMSFRMPPSKRGRIFISYAHKDGADLAQRLQADLTRRGFDTWLDKQRLEGGASWTTEIEMALDDADYVLALLTNGSYVSEICRAEQLRSLRKRKCVIPLLAQRRTEIPLHLETKNYRDFTTSSNYSNALAQVLKDIHARHGVQLQEKFRQTYTTAPPLPVNFVERPEALTALRNALITDGGSHHIALTALDGMGGIGKTVLAAALCRDEVVQQAFPDGVIWVTIGRESTADTVTRMREVGKALDDDLSRYDNALGAKNQYRSTIRSKAALIVVDDVWDSRDLAPMLAESPRSRLIFTTRDKSIAAAVGAYEHVADLLTEEQSRVMLARWSKTSLAKLPALADDLIRECGRLPLALSMVGAMLRGKPSAMLKVVYEYLRNAELGRITAHFPDYPYRSLLVALQVSVDALDATTRERYLALAVLLEDMPVLPAIQQWLWNVGQSEAVETAEKLLGLSLAQRDRDEGSIRLHDLQLDYVRAQYPNKEILGLIHEAMRNSWEVIAKDPSQFASQLVGRLMSREAEPGVEQFLEELCESAPHSWLRPALPTLKAPSTEFVRTLEGHTGVVADVALTGDGRLAVSASHDSTLKVWEVESGRELRTLKGHSGAVIGVAHCCPVKSRTESVGWRFR